MATAIQALDEAANDVLGSYEPHNLKSIQQVFPDLKNFFGTLAGQLDSLTGRLEEESPLHQDLIEALREMVSTLGGLRDSAEGAEGDFPRLHEADLDRYENPRAGEHLADYAVNEGE